MIKDDSAPSNPNVLKQSGVATYPVCLRDDSHIKDGFSGQMFVRHFERAAYRGVMGRFFNASQGGGWLTPSVDLVNSVLFRNKCSSA